MNLHSLLEQRERDGRPIRVGLIGAGRYGTMYLAQANNIPGIHVVAIADINVKRAKGAFALVGWPRNRSQRTSPRPSGTPRRSWPTPDSCSTPTSTSSWKRPATRSSASKHALRAIETGKHIIMVTVEADALAGPALARRAEKPPASSTRWPTATSLP